MICCAASGRPYRDGKNEGGSAMKSAISLMFTGACAALALFAAPAHGASDFVKMDIYIDEVRNSKTGFDLAGECADNPFCISVAEAAGAYIGIPVGEIVQAAATFRRDSNGEGMFVFADLPSGYTYCRASMKMVSIVPHDGPRGSTFLGQSRDHGFYYETWTPVRPITEGRSWVEAKIAVIGVRDDLAAEAVSSGTCGTPMRVLWYCRGGGCHDTEDKGQSKSSATRPAANSEN